MDMDMDTSSIGLKYLESNLPISVCVCCQYIYFSTCLAAQAALNPLLSITHVIHTPTAPPVSCPAIKHKARLRPLQVRKQAATSVISQASQASSIRLFFYPYRYQYPL